MSQAARVARWIPSADPDSVGEGIVSTTPPGANDVIRTKFALAADAGSTAYASDAEMVDGTETLKAVSPATYRTELVRLFAIPATEFDVPIAIGARAGNAGDINRLIKTDALGLLDDTFMPAIIDGGTF